MEYHVIDAFTDRLFGGNPAGVCLPDAGSFRFAETAPCGRAGLLSGTHWPPDAVMQNIAAENNLSETAFLVKQANGNYGLRWFTPTVEVDLCGHATLASAFVLFGEREKDARELKFDTASGELTVTKNGDWLCLDLPARPASECPVYPSIGKGLGIEPLAVYKSIRDFLVIIENEEALCGLKPDFIALESLKTEAKINNDLFGIIVTAPGRSCDFVSRYFAPNAGIPEDPVTGSAHSVLIPYWSKRLGKNVMDAQQLSARGGVLQCEDCSEVLPSEKPAFGRPVSSGLADGRVKISGKAVRYLKGEIQYASCSD